MRTLNAMAALVFVSFVVALGYISIRLPDHFTREYKWEEISVCVSALDTADDSALKVAVDRCRAAGNNAYRHELLAYQKWQLRDRRDLYAWQRANSRILFVIVITITLAGLYMAFVHFFRSDKGNAQFKVSKDGIELSSQWIGIVVMALSLGFFYLYLSNVYPIRELQSDNSNSSTTASATADKEKQDTKGAERKE